MGKERNVPLTERSNRQLHFYDDEVCKFVLCGLCPYTLFSNTKSFLGELSPNPRTPLVHEQKSMSSGISVATSLVDCSGGVGLQASANKKCTTSWAWTAFRRNGTRCPTVRNKSEQETVRAVICKLIYAALQPSTQKLHLQDSPVAHCTLIVHLLARFSCRGMN